MRIKQAFDCSFCAGLEQAQSMEFYAPPFNTVQRTVLNAGNYPFRLLDLLHFKMHAVTHF